MCRPQFALGTPIRASVLHEIALIQILLVLARPVNIPAIPSPNVVLLVMSFFFVALIQIIIVRAPLVNIPVIPDLYVVLVISVFFYQCLQLPLDNVNGDVDDATLDPAPARVLLAAATACRAWLHHPHPFCLPKEPFIFGAC